MEFPRGMAAKGRLLKAITGMAKLACAKNELILPRPELKGKKKAHRAMRWAFPVQYYLAPKAKCLRRHLQGPANTFRSGDIQEMPVSTGHVANQTCVH